LPKLDFKHPSQPPAIPIWGGAKAIFRIALGRSLPPKWSLAISMLSRRVEMRRHPERQGRMAALLEALAPPGTSRRAIERQVLLARAIRRTGGHTYAPVFRRSRQWLLETFQPEGLDVLDEAKRAGHGAVILGSHAGLNSWVGPILIRLGYPLRLIQRRDISPEKLMLLQLDGWAGQVLPFPEKGEEGFHLKRLHDLVRQGEWIQHAASNPDHRTGLTGTLLGRTVRCRRAVWALGRLTGAPLIPVLALVDERLRPRLVVGSPITVAEREPQRDPMQAAFQSYLDFLGRSLATQPWNLSLFIWEKMIWPS